MFTINFPEIANNRLAVKLSAAGERSVRNGHPWIFSDSIIKFNKEGAVGDVAIIFSVKKNEVIGVGFYDPFSPIRIKLLHHGSSAVIDKEFFSEKINAAFNLRKNLLATKTNSYRFIFGENDGFPGLIADVYAKVLVVKVYSGIWLPYLKILLELLVTISEASSVVLRLSRNLDNLLTKGALKSLYSCFKDGQVVFGNLEREDVVFLEHGINFKANVIKGHKTGYFLDHRHNRKRVGELAVGKTMLDVFSYAGGFSVHALARGANAVTSVDISEQALGLASQNVALNAHKGSHTTIAGDAFKVLEQLANDQKTYDLVVIDPPSFAKSQKEVTIAKKKYGQLAVLGSKLVSSNGLLVLASCSSRITKDEFFETNAVALKNSKRKYDLSLQTDHDIDHPVTFKEGSYLKCGYYKFKD